MLKLSLSNTIAFLALTTVTGFALIIACGTAAQPGQESNPTELPLPITGDLTPSQLATASAKAGVTQAEFATAVAQQDIQMSELATAVFSPTMTPYPTDFVKEGNPTAQERGIQALTPFPAVTVPGAVTTGVEVPQSSNSSTGPSQELLDLFRGILYRAIAQNHDPAYDYRVPVVVARVRPGQPYGNFTHPYTGKTNWRQSLEVLESYYNSLTGTVDILVSAPESMLDAGREYIAILNKSVVSKSMTSLDLYAETSKQYTEYAEEEMEIIGGEAYFYWLPLLIKDSEKWYEVPFSHLFSSRPAERIATPVPHSTHLAAALDDGKFTTIELLMDLFSSAPPWNLPAAQLQAASESSPQSPTDAVAILARDTSLYDAVARVTVLSHTDHTVPLDSIEWPDELHRTPVYEKILRANLGTVEIYHGTLPPTFDVVNDFHYMGIINQTLDIGRQYVLFLHKKWLLQGEHPGDESRNHLNQQQLDAIGGEGYSYFVTQAWIIDGETAWLIPREHILHIGANTVGDHLAGAKRGGVSMRVSALKSAIATATNSQ